MSSTGACEEEASRISVAVRCRPLSNSEKNNEVVDICRVMDQRLVILLDPGAASTDYLRHDKSKEKRFAFDQAFDPETSNQQIFQATTQPLIGSILQGFNCSVFAYGSTGAGKTFTMIGTQQSPGVMSHTVDSLFAQSGSDPCVSIVCCFIEVYNEVLRDLGSKDGREGMLDLREDPVTGPSLTGVTEFQAQSVEDVMKLLQEGNQRRTTEPTAMNVTSSRSHAVFQVRVERRDLRSEAVTLGKLSLIDLAGSERASQTHNSGMRLLEGANINRSLLALGNCINALASGSVFVPFRDSKLTRLLKDSLGGNCRTMMIANVSPSHLSYEDTLNTLKYANRAKNIRVSASQQLIQPDDHVRQYTHAIADLRQEAAILKAKLVKRAASQSLPEIEADGDESELKEASENWKLEIIKNLEARASLQFSLMEVEKALVQWKAELGQAKEVIACWQERGQVATPGRPRRSSEPRTLEEWRDLVSQIEENMAENGETRRSLSKRLQQNKEAGKELQEQLPRRVLNEDLRAFLELIQRVKVLEFERLELEHFWEIHRRQLVNRDDEIAMLREQLRLRNDHLLAQRARLPEEHQELLDDRAFLLGTAELPVQEHGPLRVMQAWAPSVKDPEEFERWDTRPLRQRERKNSTEEAQDIADLEMGAAVSDRGINWKALELPLASQIKGLAILQEDGGERSRILAQPQGQQAPSGIPQQAPYPPLRQVAIPPPVNHKPTPTRQLTSLAAHGVAPAPRPPRDRSDRSDRSPPPAPRDRSSHMTSDASLRTRHARSPPLVPRGPGAALLRAYGVRDREPQRQMDRPAQYRKSSPWRRVDPIRKAGKLMVQTPGR
ncbi:Kinesin-like protein KIF19 [Durusdinium trenchii]|uniref:Kinesin-like protein n=1 Tax=Durusdinium trenchii TaxID=1381693 RepID=A0ABP0LN98_9DINO